MQFKIQNHYTHDDRIFLIVEMIITAICMFIPLILFLVDSQTEVRPSISAYVDMQDSYIFGLLFGVVGMTFILNGALYFKVENDEKRRPELKTVSTVNETVYNKKKIGKWYNVIFGLALIGVAIFHYQRTDISRILHLAFATIFFFGSAIVIFFVHDPQDRWKSRFLAIGSLACLVASVISNGELISLFYAETVALVIIAIHYILESHRICLHYEKEKIESRD